MRNINEMMTKTAVAGRYLGEPPPASSPSFTPPLTPRALTVDSLPILNYIPAMFAPFKREASAIFDETLSLFKSHVLDVKKNVEEGRDAHCFAKYILESQKSYKLSDNEAFFLACVAAHPLAPGARVRSRSLTPSQRCTVRCRIRHDCRRHQHFHHDHDNTPGGTGQGTSRARLCRRPRSPPELRRPARPGLLRRRRARDPAVEDRHCGRACPCDDRGRLVQRCVARDLLNFGLLRLSCPALTLLPPPAFSRAGYFIPKGTIVLANHWAIHLDPVRASRFALPSLAPC